MKIKIKVKRRMTRVQFEKQFPNAKTYIDWSRNHQERKAMFAVVDGNAYDALTWADLAKKITSNEGHG